MYNSEIEEFRGRVVTKLPFSKCRLYSVDECNTSVGKWCKDNDVEIPKYFGGDFRQATISKSQLKYLNFRTLYHITFNDKEVKYGVHSVFHTHLSVHLFLFFLDLFVGHKLHIIGV
jgi:hypothetical protein